MLSPRTMEQLAACPNKGSGCFASDPESLDNLRNRGDTLHRAEYAKIASAATSAGHVGVPLEEAAYKSLSGGLIRFAKLEKGDEEKQIEFRIAKCAHACGAQAVETCPLLVRLERT